MRRPLTIFLVLEKSGRQRTEVRQVWTPITFEIQKLHRAAAGDSVKRRMRRDDFDWGKLRNGMRNVVFNDSGLRTQIPFVEPTVCLFAEDPRNPVAVEIDPLVIRTVDPGWQIVSISVVMAAIPELKTAAP